MDKSEIEFMEKLRETFHIEAKEHLQTLNSNFLSIEKKPPPEEKKALLEGAFREVHNLKGAARAVNLSEIQTLCQSLEDVLAAWKSEKIDISHESFDILYSAVDLVGKLIADPNESTKQGQLLDSLIENLKNLKNGTPITKAPQKVIKPEVLPTSTKPVLEPLEKTIRIATSKIDKLLLQVEEMLILKQLSGQNLSQLNNLSDALKLWEKENQGLEQQEFFKSFKHLFNNLFVLAEQDHRLVSGMVDSLLEDTKNVLTQPFETVLESFPRMVRDIASSIGKEVHFEVQGGAIEIDRRILEELKDPLIHMIRNSIDHGIETPEERIKRNKAAYGTLKISTSQVSGNRFEILISDDGRGIQVDKVIKAAIAQGIIDAKEVEQLSEEKALKLIFQTGISTSSIVTELSGRGVGLEVVAKNIEKLGGQIHIETKLGEGTTFKIELPLTMATFRGIHIQASKEDFIIPTRHVKRVISITQESIKTIENKETIQINGQTLSCLSLADILKIPLEPTLKAKKGTKNKTEKSLIYIVVLTAGDISIGLKVDKILNEQEVFVKSLGTPLQHVKNIAAATVLELGKVIPILDPFDLLKSVAFKDSLFVSNDQMQDQTEATASKIILVVEDSITTRMLIKNILEFAGYQVKTAVDGLEALTLLKTEKIDLVCSDIEMPRMNGFDLTIKIRETDDLKNLPVILCTSLGSQEDLEKGIKVGANAYLTKNNFHQGQLLGIIEKLL